MSMTITLSDHTAALIRAQLPHFGGSEQEVVDAAMTLLARHQEADDKLAWLRQAIAEGLTQEARPWDPDELKREIASEATTP
ncbi:MAG: type II toxin-antitoxin system ParD family antitoxin [Magnetococcales bacterium]|nr:type II toxin-antitoxin system ParD family antitoxin [Magnetococcales bacterium]MBF0262748.1 type II toxin-antitoxin system ParD family antitoxin [Magnetococcales bacterium]